MGLKEKRVIQHLEETEIPFHRRNFHQLTGSDLEVAIDWDQWSDDHAGLLNLNGYVLQQFTDSVNQIAVDAVGKEALSEGIETLEVVRVEAPESRSIGFEDGTLRLAVAPAARWDGVIASSAIKEHLLDAL